MFNCTPAEPVKDNKFCHHSFEAVAPFCYRCRIEQLEAELESITVDMNEYKESRNRLFMQNSQLCDNYQKLRRKHKRLKSLHDKLVYSIMTKAASKAGISPAKLRKGKKLLRAMAKKRGLIK